MAHHMLCRASTIDKAVVMRNDGRARASDHSGGIGLAKLLTVFLEAAITLKVALHILHRTKWTRPATRRQHPKISLPTCCIRAFSLGSEGSW